MADPLAHGLRARPGRDERQWRWCSRLPACTDDERMGLTSRAVRELALLGESPMWHPRRTGALLLRHRRAIELHRFDPRNRALETLAVRHRHGELRAGVRRRPAACDARRHLALRSGNRDERGCSLRRPTTRRASATTTASATPPAASGAGRCTSRASPRSRRCAAWTAACSRARPAASRCRNGLGLEPRRAARCTGPTRGAHHLRVRFRCEQRRDVAPARVRAVRAARARRPSTPTAAGPTALRSTARLTSGSRCTKAPESCDSRPGDDRREIACRCAARRCRASAAPT